MDNLKEELKTYVQNHINERIRLEELEKYFFYSKFHLCRKFKKKTSCTIMTYISNIKLEEAKREAKKLMISKGHTYYQSRKLDRVPREAVEELLGITFTDKSN